MERLSPEPDAAFLVEDAAEAEDDGAETDHMPINQTTINIPADASGEHWTR